MFNWLQSLVTFRKSTGGYAVPELDSQGRIRISMAPESLIVVGTSAPVTTDGTVLWNNTTVGKEGLYFRDMTRGKWLGDMCKYTFGADSSDNANLRLLGVSSVGNGSGYLVPVDMTVVHISAHARAGQSDKGLQLLVSGTSVQALALSSYNHDAEYNIDIAGGSVLSMKSDAAGSATRDIVVDVYCRRRA